MDGRIGPKIDLFCLAPKKSGELLPSVTHVIAEEHGGGDNKNTPGNFLR